MNKAVQILLFVAAPLAWGLLVEFIFHQIRRARANRKTSGGQPGE